MGARWEAAGDNAKKEGVSVQSDRLSLGRVELVPSSCGLLPCGNCGGTQPDTAGAPCSMHAFILECCMRCMKSLYFRSLHVRKYACVAGSAAVAGM